MAAKRQVVETPKYEPLMCATAGCPYDAKIRTRRKKAQWVNGKVAHVPYGPWLNLCVQCDDRKHREEAGEYCLQMGLDTPEKQRAWCISKIKTVIKRPDTRPEEPAEIPL